MDELIIAPFLRKERGFLLRMGRCNDFISTHIKTVWLSEHIDGIRR